MKYIKTSSPGRILFLAAIATLQAAMGACAGSLALTIDDSVVIITGNAGAFVLPPPVLSMSEEDYEGQKPEITREGGDVLVASYPAGMQLRIRIADKSVSYEIQNRPADAKGLRFSMLVPIAFSEGGKYAFDGAPLSPIPAAQGEQMIQQGDFTSFTLSDAKGGGMRMTLPTSWQGLQDNRVFNWEAYEFKYLYDFARFETQDSFEFQVEDIGASP